MAKVPGEYQWETKEQMGRRQLGSVVDASFQIDS
jgi:hypothetical protein